MNATIRYRTARIAHHCEGCPPGSATIAPGHRYAIHVAFPDGGVINTSGAWTAKQCIGHMSEVDDSAPLLQADACSTFCCGDEPCARPFNHDNGGVLGGGHSCRRCATDRALVSA